MNTPPAPAAVSRENIEKLKAKLRELFQLDRGDLDFGLYRVMAHNSAEVGDFVDNHLLPEVTKALGEIATHDTATLKEELDKEITEARKHISDPEDSPNVKELRKKLNAAKSDEQVEADTYNRLHIFFSRYYDEGDFMSLRRYKGVGGEAYSIPYNGEEVKLHWANADQYYIKTTENYSSYVFRVGDRDAQVCFEIAAADNEKDNIQEANENARYFFPAKKEFIVEDDGKLIIRFEHRPMTTQEKTKYPKGGSKVQEAINTDTEQKIQGKIGSNWTHLLAAPSPTANGDARTVLGKHLAAYTAKNSFDYFIHKNLGGFLHRELDNYLKSEVISIDNLEITDDPTVFIRGLAQIKAIKQVGGKIIDFLAQLEDFQKQLWEKKKFVLETQYCVTLDRVPESLYAEIIKNTEQINEWVKLCAIDELVGDTVTTAYSKPLKPNFLKENPFLVLDTRHFNAAFTDKLLAALSTTAPLDEQMNGLLVNAENFQALNLLQARYRAQVKCIYIDPPYNTDQSKILYKNNYEHSAWLSLMANRYELAENFISRDAVVMTAIDDYEVSRLCELINLIFVDGERHMIVVNHHPQGAGMGGAFLSRTHEYMVIVAMPDAQPLRGELREESIETRYYRRAGRGENNFRGEFSNSFHSILVDSKRNVVGLEDPPHGTNYPTEPTEEGYHRIYPIGDDGSERVWRHSYKTAKRVFAEGRFQCSKNNVISYTIDHGTEGRGARFSNWKEPKYNAGEYGANLLFDILGRAGAFDYPKSVYTVEDAISSNVCADKNAIILDYFAGSGTTGHAVINLNREDDGNRKYILVEMGKHFDDVIIPRMKKVIYSKDWKDGKPEDREGISQLFKYVRLESYEDTLDSLCVERRDDLVDATKSKEMTEDYKLRYALNAETTHNAALMGKDFIDPLNYTLSVVRDGVRRDVQVDLAETFNFLLGLRETARRQMENVTVIIGTTAKGEKCAILWRNLEKMNAAQLDAWFNEHHKAIGEMTDGDLNLIYVNGDHTLNALRKSTDRWEAITTEPVFKALMFGGSA